MSFVVLALMAVNGLAKQISMREFKRVVFGLHNLNIGVNAGV